MPLLPTQALIHDSRTCVACKLHILVDYYYIISCHQSVLGTQPITFDGFPLSLICQEGQVCETEVKSKADG